MGIVLIPIVEIFLPAGIGWFEISKDVISNVKVEWGIHGGSLKDRVASTGTMQFQVDNSKQNVHGFGLQGTYTPGHPNAMFGLALGIPVRLTLRHPTLGDKVVWVGTIESIKPSTSGRHPVSAFTCVDWMEEAARAKLSGLAVEIDIQSDEAFSTMIAAAPKQPPGGTQVGTGSDVYPFAFDNVQDEQSRLLGELQKLAMSEFGYIYLRAGVLVFEGRRSRGGSSLVKFALNEDTNIVNLGVAHSRDYIINRVQVSVHPRRRDAAATTQLFSLSTSTRIERSTSITLSCSYRDPSNQAERVGGVDMVTPVATTDYRFNTLADGTGDDITSQLSVVPTFGGNQATLLITNNGPLDGYIPAGALQLRGRGLYDYEPVISERQDSNSVLEFGENAYGYDMPYQSSVANAADLSHFILSLNKDPATRVESVTFVANWSELEAERVFSVGISDRVSVTSPTLGMTTQPYFVQGVRLDVATSGLVVVTWDLAPVDTTQFWVLEVAGRTELDETTVLGYGLFTVGWIMDTSALGVASFLN